MSDDHNDIYSICYFAVCFMFIQNLLPRLPCIFQQFTLCYCLVTSLLCCSLWKSVYISRQWSHFLEVHLLHKKILEMPLFTFVGVVLAVHSKSRGFLCVMRIHGFVWWQILPFSYLLPYFLPFPFTSTVADTSFFICFFFSSKSVFISGFYCCNVYLYIWMANLNLRNSSLE